MHRTKIKRLTPEAELLKKLRTKRKLSLRQAGEAAGKSITWVSHLENGRVDVSKDHISLLLPLYGQTERSFRAFLSGAAIVSCPLKQECIDTINDLPDNLIESLHPLIMRINDLTKKPNKPSRKEV